MKLVALAGGVGGSKLVLGLSRVMDPRALSVIVNTGDDLCLHGLEISPDLDTVTYTLAGVVNPKTGWGFARDTFHLLERLAIFEGPQWFNLGDRDLATHTYRTERLRRGGCLSDIADEIRKSLGVKSRILPMSDQPVRTMVTTRVGVLQFQEYFVKERTRPVVCGLKFAGSRTARPAPGVLQALREADGIVICPSNPLISIGPILAVKEIREMLRKRRDRVIAVSPIVGGKSLKGPSDRMLRQLGHEVSAVGVARLYRDFCGTMIIDRSDAQQAPRIEGLGMRVVLAQTVMRTLAEKMRLARIVLAALEGPRSPKK
jgi:LPPG:FO 2-phospho-L-lactate transferase